MKAVNGVVVAIVVAASVVAASVTTLSAQWLKHPTARVPRLADGKPNLAAPAPRMADGTPDLSGMWDIEHNRPCPPGGCADMEVGQEFVNIGWGLKGGLPYQPWAADTRRKRMEQNGKDDPGSHCLPPGVVKSHTSPLFRKIVQTPDLVVILYERDDSQRQIFTDGRPLPAIEMPSFNGYSVGRWEGETLVVQTTGFKDDEWLDRSGSPLTEAAKITERFRRLNYGKLDIEVTVDDPKAYTAPWTVTLHHSLKLDTELLSYICMENEKSIPHLVGK